MVPRIGHYCCRSIGIGGWHVSEFLKQFLEWKKEGAEVMVREATTSSLDTAGFTSGLHLADPYIF
jgi:hypothetical protein